MRYISNVPTICALRRSYLYQSFDQSLFNYSRYKWVILLINPQSLAQ